MEGKREHFQELTSSSSLRAVRLARPCGLWTRLRAAQRGSVRPGLMALPWQELVLSPAVLYCPEATLFPSQDLVSTLPLQPSRNPYGVPIVVV